MQHHYPLGRWIGRLTSIQRDKQQRYCQRGGKASRAKRSPRYHATSQKRIAILSSGYAVDLLKPRDLADGRMPSERASCDSDDIACASRKQHGVAMLDGQRQW